MKILLIGLNMNNMPAWHHAKGFKELGHETRILDMYDVFNKCRNPVFYLHEYNVRKKQIKFSDLKRMGVDVNDYDLIFVQQTWLHMLNDCANVPVYYQHSEIQAPITCHGATHVGIGYTEAINQLRRYYPREFFKWKSKNFLWFGVDPEQYMPLPDNEKIPGMHFIKNKEWRAEATNYDSPYWSRTIYQFRDGVLEKYKDNIELHDHVPYTEYVKLLPQFETVVVIHGNGCYPSQRVIEAVAAGCKVKIFHENTVSIDVYKSFGPLTRDNIIKNHTYINRAKQILEEVKDDL